VAFAGCDPGSDPSSTIRSGSSLFLPALHSLGMMGRISSDVDEVDLRGVF
jgi:hypothetical protein